MKARGGEPARRVAVRWDASLRGRVVAAGPEQTEVVLDGASRGSSRVFRNEDLVKLIRRGDLRRRRMRQS